MSNYYMCDYCRNCRRMVKNDPNGKYYVACMHELTPREIIVSDGSSRESDLCSHFSPITFGDGEMADA